MSNPFERFDIDPMQGPAAITERMRDLTEDADEGEREELRAVWEELTTDPRRRFQVALNAFPETRAPLPEPERPAKIPGFSSEIPLTLRELAVIPRVAQALGDPPQDRPAALPPIESDPFIETPDAAK